LRNQRHSAVESRQIETTKAASAKATKTSVAGGLTVRCAASAKIQAKRAQTINAAAAGKAAATWASLPCANATEAGAKMETLIASIPSIRPYWIRPMSVGTSNTPYTS